MHLAQRNRLVPYIQSVFQGPALMTTAAKTGRNLQMQASLNGVYLK